MPAVVIRQSSWEGLTWNLVFAIFTAAFGSGFQHGYNTGVVNAPQTVVEKFINDTYYYKYEKEPTRETVTIIFSTMVSIFCLGGMIGALCTAFLAERFGRRGALMLNNILVFVATALMSFSQMARSYEMLILGRLVIGMNCGLNAGLAPMYLTEISPVHLRGAVGTLYQLVITISILISQILGMTQVLGTEEGWPILFGLIIVPSILMIVTLPVLPETPKYVLINKGDEEGAQKALHWLRGTTEVNDEMEDMRVEVEEMKAVPKVELKDMWENKALRKPLVIAIVMMLSQQLSGINAVIFYSTDIFINAGLTKIEAINATLGIGTINVLMTIVSMVLVERAGRRTLHLIGLGGMAIICVLLTICLALTPLAPWLTYFSIIDVVTFIIMFATGPGSIPWFLVTELFGQGARPIATSIAVAVNWMANFIVGLTFLPLTQLIAEYTFLIFAILLALFWVFTYYLVPETKGRTVEEISASFKETAPPE